MLKILTALWLISGITASSFFLWYVYRKTHPVPCDTCKWLKQKGGNAVWRYYCQKRSGGYDKPPQYCCEWEPRETHNDEM